MLGNDVVDLADAETRAGAQHPRFDARVLSAAERAALAAAPDTEAARRLRWTFFAAKEAAYKLVRRLEPRTPFAPTRFEVTLLGDGAARVRHEGRVLDVALEECDGAIHAVASPAGADGGRRVAALAPAAPDEDEGAAARRLACTRVAAALGVAASRLDVVREGRLPALRLDGAPLDATLSLSHHGRFVGFACELGGSASSHATTGGAR